MASKTVYTAVAKKAVSARQRLNNRVQIPAESTLLNACPVKQRSMEYAT